MIDRLRIYRAVCRRLPGAWKLARLALWGKVNFNDLAEWENSYQDPTPEELEELTNRIPNVVEAALRLVEAHGSVLDVSAGFGNFVGKINSDKICYATEFSPAAIRYLQSLGVETRKAALPELPFDDCSVDVISSISVFEHLPRRSTVSASFRECHRVCREGMVFSVPFGCMQPWSTLIHNFDFTKELVVELSAPWFRMKSWEVIRDGATTRSVSFLEKR